MPRWNDRLAKLEALLESSIADAAQGSARPDAGAIMGANAGRKEDAPMAAGKSCKKCGKPMSKCKC